ncbi:hypothetical protein [Streptomyces sp. NPDC002855]|uniref:hypothetical protein n=1 Tax=Streptomyces sp. NPDC002855 TaxID=3154437 RepID=UPI00332EE5DE
MTAVVDAPWTAAQFNTHVRDNLLETMPAKATAANRMYVTTGEHALAERVPDAAVVTTSQTTTSTTYADLATVGPAVTVTTGTSAVVWINVKAQNSTANALMAASVAVSGATTIAASDTYRVMYSGVAAANENRAGICHRFANLNPGSNVFTMKYRVGAGTGTFAQREIVVLPL